jgi:hypothetical protein
MLCDAPHSQKGQSTVLAVITFTEGRISVRGLENPR